MTKTLHLATAVVAVSTVCAGCATRSALRREVADARIAAAERLIKRKPDSALSQPRIDGNLGLRDAVKLALEWNRSLQAVLEEREVAVGRVHESWGAALPHLSANAGYTRLDEVTSFNAGGMDVSLGTLDNYSADLTVVMPVAHGGAIRGTLATARLAQLAADESSRQAIQGTIFQTTKSYYDASLADQLLKVKESAVQSADSHLGDVKSRRQQGVVSDFDVLRAEVELSNARAEMIRQKNSASQSFSELLRTLGVALDSRAILSDEPAYQPMAPVFEEAARLALANRPDLAQAEIGTLIQKQALRLARSTYWPSIDAFFTKQWANPDPHSMGDDSWGDAWTAGAKLSLPLFDGMSREGKVRQEKAKLRQAQTRLEDAEQQALLELKQAIMGIVDAEQLVESQKLTLEQAAKGLKLVESAYREGAQPQTAVMDARTALMGAQVLHFQSIYAHAIARLALEMAMGTLNETQPDGLAPREQNTTLENRNDN